MKTFPVIATVLIITLFHVHITYGIGNQVAEQKIKPIQSGLNKNFFFEGNKGQLTDPSIKFYGHSKGVYTYCKPGMISFVFTRNEKDEKISEATGLLERERERGGTASTSRMDLVFMGSDPDAKIIAADQQDYYENFYTNGDVKRGITIVHTFNILTYKNIYPNIDMILETAGQGMEYSFLIHPGGDVSSIRLKWAGVNKSENIANGGIRYSNVLGSMEQNAPESFVIGKLIQSAFVKHGAVYSFRVGNYDKTKELVIDPTLVWGTYYGGGEEEGLAVSTDASGNVFIAGRTGSNIHIATAGGYQTSWGGGYDGYLAKFNSSGAILWATYFGGSGMDMASGVCTDASGNAFVTGSAGSAGLATSGAYQTSNAAAGGGFNTEAFLAKFNGSGILSWATYYGNSGDEGEGVSIDASGNIFMTGNTGSYTGIATSGAFLTSLPDNGGGSAFLAKFSNSGNLLWGTYFGGNFIDYAWAVKTDSKGNAYIAGQTESSSGIATSGAYQTSYGGGPYDAYLAKFSSSGSLSWASYFGGNDWDRARGVSTDHSDNVYITGYTTSEKGISTSGAYQTAYNDSGDVFLAKFSSSGSLSWATYYGGSGLDEAFGVNNDLSGNVYITGHTTSLTNIATAGSFQNSPVGSNDIYLAEFNSSGGLTWATYYGDGGLSDQGNGISIDASSAIYLTGTTGSGGIITSGAYQTTFNAGGSGAGTGAFLAKFSKTYQVDAGVSSVLNSADSICGSLQPVKVQLKNYGTTNLTSTNIGWEVNGTAQTSYSWTGNLSEGSSTTVNLGNFNFSNGANVVKAWTSKPNGKTDSLPADDTSQVSFMDFPIPSVNAGKPKSICAGGSDTIGTLPMSGLHYSWTSNPKGFTSGIDDPIVNPAVTTVYILTETVLFTHCSNADSVKITVLSTPDIGFTYSKNALDYYFTAKDSSFPKSSYKWYFGDGSSIGTGYHVEHTYTKDVLLTVKLIVTGTNGCTGEYDSAININIAGINADMNPNVYGLTIYPNPFTNSTNINFTLPDVSHVKINLTDMAGKIIYAPADKMLEPGPNQIEINASDLGISAGVYFVNMNISGQVINRKIILVKQ